MVGKGRLTACVMAGDGYQRYSSRPRVGRGPSRDRADSNQAVLEWSGSTIADQAGRTAELADVGCSPASSRKALTGMRCTDPIHTVLMRPSRTSLYMYALDTPII
jgi:hypothetical protein